LNLREGDNRWRCLRFCCECRALLSTPRDLDTLFEVMGDMQASSTSTGKRSERAKADTYNATRFFPLLLVEHRAVLRVAPCHEPHAPYTTHADPADPSNISLHPPPTILHRAQSHLRKRSALRTDSRPGELVAEDTVHALEVTADAVCLRSVVPQAPRVHPSLSWSLPWHVDSVFAVFRHQRRRGGARGRGSEPW